MSLRENVSDCFHGYVKMGEALGQIARGRPDNGGPIAAEDARQIARNVLTELGLSWPKQERPPQHRVLSKPEANILRMMVDAPDGEIQWRPVFDMIGEQQATARLSALRDLGLIEHPGYNRWKITEKGRIAFGLLPANRIIEP